MILLATVLIGRGVTAPETTLSAPILIDKDLTAGETFSIDITVARVNKLWGFEFALFYNTTLLTATGNASYSPFTNHLFSQINDTAGYAFVAYLMPYGEKVGFSTVDAAAIVRIDFSVDTLGTSRLNLSGSVMTEPGVDPSGNPIQIPHEVVNGFFANVPVELHDVAVTDVTVSSTTVLVNESVTVTVATENQGEFSETFDVSVYYDSTLIGTQTDVTLSAGDNTTLTFTWDTTGVAGGTYTIKAEASVVSGEIDTGDNRFINGKVTVTTGEKQEADLVLYAVAGIVIAIAAAAILVYFLKIRKPKPT